MFAYITEDRRLTTTVDRDARRATDLGFTLVEILIVVVIIGVISAVVVFAVRGIRDEGEAASCRTDSQILGNAAAYYLASEGVDQIPASGAADADRYERTLVDADVLREVSAYHDLSADGTVTTTGVPCP
jgi:prepilin-type N-terminal cleavage/methylation domain-containing protein